MRDRSSELAQRGSYKSLWITLGVVAGLVLTAMAYQSLPHYDPVRAAAWDKVRPRINKTSNAGSSGADAAAEPVRNFFAERKANARAFASELLSLSGKWAFMKGYFTKGSHEQYVQECFERNIFSSDELKKLIESAVASYVSDIQGRENQLLVDIRADLEGSELAGPEYLPALGDEARFRSEYTTMLEQVLPLVTKDMGVSVTRELVSFVGAELTATLVMELGVGLATELGISGGILGAGAYSGAATFGVGLVAGILVDMALDFAIREAGYDPEGEVAAKVAASLDRVERLILEGDEKAAQRHSDAMWRSTFSWTSADRDGAWAEAQSIESGGGLGLPRQLRRINDTRSRLREEALKALILTGGAQ